MSSETPVIVVDGAEEPGNEYVTPFRCTDLDSWFVIVRQRTTLTWDFAPADGAASGRYSALPDSDGSTEIVTFGALMCASPRCGGMRSARGAPPESGSSDGSGRARRAAPGAVECAGYPPVGLVSLEASGGGVCAAGAGGAAG